MVRGGHRPGACNGPKVYRSDLITKGTCHNEGSEPEKPLNLGSSYIVNAPNEKAQLFQADKDQRRIIFYYVNKVNEAEMARGMDEMGPAGGMVGAPVGEGADPIWGRLITNYSPHQHTIFPHQHTPLTPTELNSQLRFEQKVSKISGDVIFPLNYLLRRG